MLDRARSSRWLLAAFRGRGSQVASHQVKAGAAAPGGSRGARVLPAQRERARVSSSAVYGGTVTLEQTPARPRARTVSTRRSVHVDDRGQRCLIGPDKRQRNRPRRSRQEADVTTLAQSFCRAHSASFPRLPGGGRDPRAPGFRHRINTPVVLSRAPAARRRLQRQRQSNLGSPRVLRHSSAREKLSSLSLPRRRPG